MAPVALNLVATQESPSPATVRRWPEALRAADAQPDPLERARARVEVLYAAGDLPSALREALAGLRDHGDDPPLLRRACELAVSLRAADLAESHAARLASLLPRLPGGAAERSWWEKTSHELSRDAQALRVRAEELRRDVRRARWTSLSLLGAVLAAVLVLGGARAEKAPAR